MARPSSTDSQDSRTHAAYHHAQPVEGHMGINAPAPPSCFSFLSSRHARASFRLFLLCASGTLLSRCFSPRQVRGTPGERPLAVIAASLSKRWMMLRGLDWKHPLTRALLCWITDNFNIFIFILLIQQYIIAHMHRDSHLCVFNLRTLFPIYLSKF